MQDGNRTGRRHRRTAVSVIGLTVCCGRVGRNGSSTPGVTGTANVNTGVVGARSRPANVKTTGCRSTSSRPQPPVMKPRADPVGG